VFTVSLSAAVQPDHQVTVPYATASGPAVAGFTAASGTLTFSGGQSVEPVDVALLDASVKKAKHFYLKLGAATGVITATRRGRASGRSRALSARYAGWRRGRSAGGHRADDVVDGDAEAGEASLAYGGAEREHPAVGSDQPVALPSGVGRCWTR